MKRILFLLLSVNLLLLICFGLKAQTLIFSEDFETWPNSWTIVNGTQTNKWEVGTATANNGTQSAYISNNG